MDPVTAAGLALSVTSLGLQLFAGCIKGYQLFLDASDMPVKYESLRVRMRIEQVRLLNWGEKAGLLQDLLEEPSVTLQLHHNLLFDVFLEIQKLFRDCLKIEAKFGSLPSPEKGQPVTDGSQKLISSSQKTPNKLLSKALKILEKASEAPTRLQWAAVKQEKFETLIERLISYNDSIVSLLDRATVQQLYEMQMQSQLTMLQLSSKIDDLKELAVAMRMQTNSGRQSSDRLLQDKPSKSQELITGREENNAIFARLASFKAQQLSLEYQPLTKETKAVESSLVTSTDDDTTRSPAQYKQDPVWIEWKEYEAHDQIPWWNQMIADRIQKLVALLSIEDKPKEFRAPYCLGYIHDDKDEDTPRYGLIYQIPSYAPPSATPQSLSDLIRHGEKPSLTSRISLAHTIARSLMFLHSVNWLHKSIRSENIVFFTNSLSPPIDYTNPTISGFDYARPDLPDEMTEKPPEKFEHDIYLHPNAIGRSASSSSPESRSRKSWDIYSLGIVLLEIAFWRDIGDIVDVHRNQKGSRSKIRKIRAMILDETFLKTVGVEVGDRYRDVVRCCISGGRDLGIQGGDDESDPDVGAEIQIVFSEKVLGALKSIEL